MEVSLRGVCVATLMLTRVWFGVLVLRMVVLVVPSVMVVEEVIELKL